MDEASAAVTPTRRSFLGSGIAAIGAFVTAVLGSSTTLFAASPIFSARRGLDVSLGPVAAFTVGVPKLVDFPVKRRDGWVADETTKSVWVVRTGETSFATYNPRCTHLGCAVSWNESAKAFRSPCHGGVFSLDGAVIAGPPPRPLDRLDNRIERGNLVIRYQEFRLGIPEKVEV